MNPQGSGASACRSRDVDEAAGMASAKLVQAAGWQGMFMVELLRDSADTAWFMEFNGRAWGSMALARRRGFAYPAWTVQSSLGWPLEPSPPEHPGPLRCRHLGRDLVHVAMVARGSTSGPAESWPRLTDTLVDVFSLRRGEQFYNLRRGQATVFAADTWQTLASKVRSSRRTR